jgi:hypothetical protein
MLVFACVLVLPACKKEEEPEAHDDMVNTEVKVQVNFVQNGAAFDPTTMLIADSLGVPMKVGRLRFFVSRPLFLDDVGDTVATFPGRYLLMDQSSNGVAQTVGQVNGHLHELHFGLGLDSVTNHTDPTTFTQPPLNDPTMHWGWNPDNGYQFLQMEGFYESNGDGVVNAFDNGFLYHAGGDALLTFKELEVHTDALSGSTLVLVLECDVNVLMQGLSVVNDPVSEVVDATTQRLMNNLSNSLTHP